MRPAPCGHVLARRHAASLRRRMDRDLRADRSVRRCLDGGSVGAIGGSTGASLAQRTGGRRARCCCCWPSRRSLHLHLDRSELRVGDDVGHRTRGGHWTHSHTHTARTRTQQHSAGQSLSWRGQDSLCQRRHLVGRRGRRGAALSSGRRRGRQDRTGGVGQPSQSSPQGTVGHSDRALTQAIRTDTGCTHSSVGTQAHRETAHPRDLSLRAAPPLDRMHTASHYCDHLVFPGSYAGAFDLITVRSLTVERERRRLA